MSSLADLPELVGFFSYSREDDADSRGALSALRNRIQGELRGQLGRTARTFRLWQDKEAIPSGTLWETEIKNAVAQSVFFIPIITPTVVASHYCRFELESFLAREAELGRDDLVFPILYIDVPGLEDSAQLHNDPALSMIAKRQYADWRRLRHRDVYSTDVSEAVERFCMHIRDALRRPWLRRHPDRNTIWAWAAGGPAPSRADQPSPAAGAALRLPTHVANSLLRSPIAILGVDRRAAIGSPPPTPPIKSTAPAARQYRQGQRRGPQWRVFGCQVIDLFLLWRRLRLLLSQTDLLFLVRTLPLIRPQIGRFSRLV